MFVRLDPVLGTFRILLWQWKSALFFTVSAVVIVGVHQYWLPLLELPAFPLAVVGGAIGIFVSFRSNAGYDRWWEGRKLWGSLVNASRMLATQMLTYSADKPAAAHIVKRHIAYVHLLRCALRGQPLAADAEVRAFLSAEEVLAYSKESNPAHALLQRQMEEIVALSDAGHIDQFRLQRIDETISRFLDIQGGCERIQKTTFPPGYGFVAERLIQALGVLLPLGLVEQLGWFTVPISLLVCLAFRMIGEVGRTLENPFTMFWPALPLSALSKTIELNLRQRLGEVNLPPTPSPDERGVLM